jgi:hypothetical protein
MVLDLPNIQSSRFRAAPRVFAALSYDFPSMAGRSSFSASFALLLPRASREAADRLFRKVIRRVTPRSSMALGAVDR